MKSSGSSLASRFLRRRGQGSKRGEERDDGKASSAMTSTTTTGASSPSHHHPATSTSTPSGPAPLVQVEPLHSLSSAALHTTSLGAAARALRGEVGKEGGVGVAAARENTPAEELLAVATMASLFGFVFVGPWLTLLALVDVVSSTARSRGWIGSFASGPSGSSSSSSFSFSSSFYFSLAFLALVAALTFLPVFPRGAWPFFRNARVWDCWRRYFQLRVITPPLPYLELEESEGGGEEEKKKLNNVDGKAAASPPLTSSSSTLLLPSPPSSDGNDKPRHNKKAYIFAHYPHGCFPVGSFLTAVGLVGCPETGLPAGTRPAVASALFHLPVLRQVFSYCNCVPCDSKTLSGLLRSGISIGVIPEGIAGIFHGSAAAKVSSLKDLLPPLPTPASPRSFFGSGSNGSGSSVPAPAAASADGDRDQGDNPAAAAAAATTAAPPVVREERIFTKHKGFVKLALRTGASIVPVYALGQSRVLSFWGFPNLSRRLRVSLGVWWGRFGLPCLPRREEIVMVVCPPVEVGPARGSDHPVSQEEIDAVFAEVAAALKKAHDEIKMGVKGWENSEMVFC